MSDANPVEIDKTAPVGDSVSQNEKKSRKDKSKSLTKVVIRRLPPSMNEETFLNQIQPVPEYDYFYFVSADWSLGRNATSRAYINFLNEEDIFIFKDRFDGYVFVEATGGVEYPAIVEFAPFQGLPKSKSRKKDNKCNTIESDPDFIKFLSYLNGEGGDAKPDTKMEYSYQIKDEKKITSTPLLEYIANKKVERREERKKKIDDRKRQRDEERNRKKNQVAKLIPSSIREQEEDGIIVRVVKSRRDRGDRSKKDRSSEQLNKPTAADAKQNKPESNREEKRRLEREQREQKRKEDRQRFREERDQKRQADRERNRKERESNKNKDDAKTEKGSAKVETDAPNKSNQKEDRVKRYSESRRARMESKDQNDAGNKGTGAADRNRDNDNTTGKNEGDADERKEAEKAVPHSKVNDSEKSTTTEDTKNNGDGDNVRESSSKSLTKEERLARRIRNKDRPSLQIYQPGQGKRRMSTKKDDDVSADDASPNVLSKPSSPTSSENAIAFAIEKPNTTGRKSGDKSKKDRTTTGDRGKPMQSSEKGRSEKSNESSKPNSKGGQSASKTSQQTNDEIAEPKVERKVSRYSERRNKNKEKQISKSENSDAVNDAANAVDESKNNSGEANNSEIQ